MREPTAAVTINRPRVDVFSFLADGTNDTAWVQGVRECLLTGYGGGAGAMYCQSMQGSPLHRRILRYRIVNFHYPALLSREATSLPGAPVGRFRLSVAGDSETTVVLSMDVPKGVIRKREVNASAGWALQLMASLPQLKASLEEKSG